MVRYIDLNADCGESFGIYKLGRSEEVLKYVTTGHMGCGFHGGDPVWMKRTVEIAKKYGVDFGAHPGLPDLMGFGRRIMQVSPEEAKCYVTYQVGAAKAFIEAAGLSFNHTKPHGAFYIVTYGNEDLAVAMIEGILDAAPQCQMMLLPAPLNYPLAKIAQENGMKVGGEFYPELLYNADGGFAEWRLHAAYEMRPREMTPQGIAEKVLRFATDRKISTIDGKLIEFEAESVCIHGDTQHAPEVLQAIRLKLEEAKVPIIPARKILGLG